MIITDYNSLVRQIQNFANRSVADKVFNLSIPVFIQNAQDRIWRESKDLAFEIQSEQGKISENIPFVDKPNNWNKTLSFAITKVQDRKNQKTYFLEPHTYEYCIGVWPNPNEASINNPPLYYSDYPLRQTASNANYNLDKTAYTGWYISPTPAEDFVYNIIYTGFVVNISQTNPTNSLIQRYPDLLFYACMCEAFNFTQELERLQSVESSYNKSLESVNAQTQDRYSDRTSNRRIN